MAVPRISEVERFTPSDANGLPQHRKPFHQRSELLEMQKDSLVVGYSAILTDSPIEPKPTALYSAGIRPTFEVPEESTYQSKPPYRFQPGSNLRFHAIDQRSSSLTCLACPSRKAILTAPGSRPARPSIRPSPLDVKKIKPNAPRT